MVSTLLTIQSDTVALRFHPSFNYSFTTKLFSQDTIYPFNHCSIIEISGVKKFIEKITHSILSFSLYWCSITQNNKAENGNVFCLSIYSHIDNTEERLSNILSVTQAEHIDILQGSRTLNKVNQDYRKYSNVGDINQEKIVYQTDLCRGKKLQITANTKI